MFLIPTAQVPSRSRDVSRGISWMYEHTGHTNAADALAMCITSLCNEVSCNFSRQIIGVHFSSWKSLCFVKNNGMVCVRVLLVYFCVRNTKLTFYSLAHKRRRGEKDSVHRCVACNMCTVRQTSTLGQYVID